MPRDRWMQLDVTACQIWDKLDDKAKATIFGLRDQPQFPTRSGHQQTNLHEISIADFLQATSGSEEWPGHYSEIYDFVYNPARNAMPTTAGIGGELWDGVTHVSKELDDGLFPVVSAGSVTVDCW